jgi:integrase
MELVRVKGSTKRQKEIVILTPDQFKALVEALPEPYDLMVLVSGCLGLRVSEILALKWRDFNFDECTLSIGQVFTHGQVQNVPKTDASGNEIPVHPKLCETLRTWHTTQKHDYSWVFASTKTGSPFSDATILNNYIKPAAAKLGIKGVGWHTFRHSYKSWMAAAKISPAQMRDLMRHSDIETTMNVYGKTLTPEMRAANRPWQISYSKRRPLPGAESNPSARCAKIATPHRAVDVAHPTRRLSCAGSLDGPAKARQPRLESARRCCPSFVQPSACAG